MTSNSGQTQTNLGYFGPFMAAWGKADEQTRAAVYDLTLAYRSGTLTADQEVRQVSTDLGVPIPQGY